MSGRVISVEIKGGTFPDDMADALLRLSDLKLVTQWVELPSDGTIAKLKNLRRLEIIEFGGPGISDSTIAYLKDVKGLKHLHVEHGTRITDAGLAHFTAFASLEYLKIDGGAITDAGMSQLKNLRNLKGLDLRNIAVTDAGLAELKSLNKLNTLRLYECEQITARGVRALQDALPNTRIGWNKCAIEGDLF